MSDPEGGRLSGWSRRKLDAKRQEKAAEEPPVEPVAEEDGTPPLADPDAIAALPSLDEIKAGFDMAPFLAKGVPTHLKNAALRKLWQASPAVRDYLDPAVDYAWDWNAPGGVPGGGGVLSEQSVAKMVNDIIGTKPEDSEDVIADGAPPPDAEQAESADQTDTPDPEPVAVRQPEKHPPAASPPDDADTPPKADHAALAPRSRHGGAMPE